MLIKNSVVIPTATIELVNVIALTVILKRGRSPNKVEISKAIKNELNIPNNTLCNRIDPNTINITIFLKKKKKLFFVSRFFFFKKKEKNKKKKKLNQSN